MKNDIKNITDDPILMIEVLKNLSEGVCVIRQEDSIILYTNEKFEKLFGYNHGEMIDKDVAIVNAPTDKTPAEVKNDIVDILKKNKKWNGEVKNIKKDGTYFWCHVNVSMFDYLEYGKIIVAVHTDITEQRNQINELKENEARFRSYFNMPLNGIAITSPKKIWVEVNDKVCSMFGYSREEITKMTWLEMTHPDDMLKDEEQFDRMIAGEIDSYFLEKRFICKDKTIIWVNLAVGCVKKEDGVIDYIIATLENVSDRKKTEDKLKEKLAELEKMNELMIDRELKMVELKEEILKQKKSQNL